MVSILGVNFPQAPDSVNSLTFNGVGAEIKSVQPNRILALVPPGAITGKVRLTYVSSLDGALKIATSPTDFVVTA
jgi:hypothetical protein